MVVNRRRTEAKTDVSEPAARDDIEFPIRDTSLFYLVVHSYRRNHNVRSTFSNTLHYYRDGSRVSLTIATRRTPRADSCRRQKMYERKSKRINRATDSSYTRCSFALVFSRTTSSCSGNRFARARRRRPYTQIGVLSGIYDCLNSV